MSKKYNLSDLKVGMVVFFFRVIRYNWCYYRP